MKFFQICDHGYETLLFPSFFSSREEEFVYCVYYFEIASIVITLLRVKERQDWGLSFVYDQPHRANTSVQILR